MFELPDEYFIRLSIPRYLTNKKIKEVSIIPLFNGKKFEIAYTYLDEEEINEILQPFIKIPGETREIKNKSIYMSSN